MQLSSKQNVKKEVFSVGIGPTESFKRKRIFNLLFFGLITFFPLFLICSGDSLGPNITSIIRIPLISALILFSAFPPVIPMIVFIFLVRNDLLPGKHKFENIDKISMLTFPVEYFKVDYCETLYESKKKLSLSSIGERKIPDSIKDSLLLDEISNELSSYISKQEGELVFRAIGNNKASCEILDSERFDKETGYPVLYLRGEKVSPRKYKAVINDKLLHFSKDGKSYIFPEDFMNTSELLKVSAKSEL